MRIPHIPALFGVPLCLQLCIGLRPQTKEPEDERTIDLVRPQYWTPDGWTVPGVRHHGKGASDWMIVALSAYGRIRDALTERYGEVTITHDALVPPDDVECWPQCRGAYRKSWWECGCPCGGASHGSHNWLLNRWAMGRVTVSQDVTREE